MPTYYEGNPVIKIKQVLKRSEFTEFYLVRESFLSPLHHPKVKAGICLTGAMILGSLILWNFRRFSTVWTLSCGILAFLLLGIFFLFVQPNIIGRWAEKVFDSNQLLKLETTISVYRDSVLIENEFESYIEYWIDFERCLETDQLYLLIGGFNRSFLIVSKEEMDKSQRELLSTHFSNVFCQRYRKVGRL